MSEPVLFDLEDGVATLTLNRPEHNNGWTDELGTVYLGLLDRCNRDPDVRAVIVTGAGKSFCPGADMSFLGELGASGGLRPEVEQRLRLPAHLATLIGKPVIGAINGACAGLGLVHALFLDVRFAARGAKFTFAFSQRGLVAEYGAAWMLSRMVGMAQARELLLSSRVFQADEACDLGLVHRVFEPDQLLAETRAYARTLADTCSPVSMAMMKKQLLEHSTIGLEEAISATHPLIARSLQRADFREGIGSWRERRPPRFSPYSGAVDPLAAD